MSKCTHPEVTINVDFVQHAQLVSADATRGADAIVRVVGPVYGPGPSCDGWWRKAYLFVTCVECGHTESVSSASCHSWPKWLIRHWQRLVAAGGLAAEINRHYRMFEEPSPSAGGPA